MKQVFYPHRLVYLAPIVWLQLQFADTSLGFIYGVMSGYITSKMFPCVERVKTEKETDK